MHPTNTSYQLSGTDEGVQRRLSLLLTENERAAGQAHLFRDGREEEEMLLMRRPVTTQQAYALFGLLLGTLPPAAIFLKLFGGDLIGRYFHFGIFLLFFSMNLVCALAGRHFGSKLSRMAASVERDAWGLMLIESLIIGFLWGAATGAAGGVLAYGIGALFGALCAIPVGMLAYGLFVPLHRLLARGGMIDARHLWPLACGVVLGISALILNL